MCRSNDEDGDVEAEQLQQLALDDVADRATSTSPSTDDSSIRLSSRARKPVQCFDYLLAASSHFPRRTRKRPAASTGEVEDSAKEGDTETASKRVVINRRNKRHSTHDEVAVLVAKLKAASRRRVDMEAVSQDVIAQLRREVLLRKTMGVRRKKSVARTGSTS